RRWKPNTRPSDTKTRYTRLWAGATNPFGRTDRIFQNTAKRPRGKSPRPFACRHDPLRQHRVRKRSGERGNASILQPGFRSGYVRRRSMHGEGQASRHPFSRQIAPNEVAPAALGDVFGDGQAESV